MTHDDATRRAAQLNEQEAGGRRWFVRGPKPTEPPGPRPSSLRQIPPYGGGIG